MIFHKVFVVLRDYSLQYLTQINSIEGYVTYYTMDLAVNDYSKGEEVTQWVRVQSSDPALLMTMQCPDFGLGTVTSC